MGASPGAKLFAKGSEVEVEGNEEGFTGSWYVATVLAQTPRSSSKKKKKTPGSNKLFVQYHTLLAEDGTSPLKEDVDVALVRPLPPPPPPDPDDLAPSFELYGVVDAYLRDGWWTGVITRVLENARFVVTFTNPPDELEFGTKDLRFHQDWVDGNWVRPEKQDALLPVDHQEHVGQACIAANSAHMALQFGASGGTKDNSEERMPVSLNSGEYETEQSAPSKGKRSSYGMASFRKKTTKQENTASDASHSRPSKKLKGNAPETPSVTRYQLDTMLIQTPPKETVWDFSSPATGTDCSKQSMNGDQSSAKTQSHTRRKKVEISQLKYGESIPTQRRGRPPKIKGASPDAGKEQNGDVAPDVLVAKDCSTNEVELDTTTGGESKKTPNGQTWRENMPSSMIKSCPAKTDKLSNVKVMQASSNQLEKPSSKRGRRQTANASTVSQDSQDTSREKIDEVFKGIKADSTRKELTMAIAVVPCNMSDDQPLSTWFDGVSNNRIGQQCTEIRKRQREFAMQGAAVSGSGDIMPDPNQRLPFSRTVPLWQTIESMEVFQAMPQKPHFHPLNSCKEGSREGLAIGWMVTFCNAVKKTSVLQFTDPRSSIEDNLETLVDLEGHGFDVGKIRDRLTELLLIKDRQELLQDQSKELEIQIMHHNHEKTYVDEEIAEIDKQIRELQGKRALSLSKKEKMDSEIASFESSVAMIHEGVKSIQLEFEELAAAPW